MAAPVASSAGAEKTVRVGTSLSVLPSAPGAPSGQRGKDSSAIVLQKMRLEGVPIKMVAAMVDMTSMSVIAKNPAIKSIADLKGKTIAADMASSEYTVLSLYGKHKGVGFGTDVTVVQAGPPLVRTQLAADRVDAGMTWEPTLTMTMRDNAACPAMPKASRKGSSSPSWTIFTAKTIAHARAP